MTALRYAGESTRHVRRMARAVLPILCVAALTQTILFTRSQSVAAGGSPVTVGTSSSPMAYQHPAQDKVAYLHDGSLLVAFFNGSHGVVDRVTNPSTSPVTSLVQTIGGDEVTLYTLPGSGTTDVWIQAGHELISGALEQIQHGVFNGNAFTWDTQTEIPGAIASGRQDPSVTWTGKWLIATWWDDTAGSNSDNVFMNWTTDKTGQSGWLSTAIQMTTTNQNTTQVNIRHSAKLGATIAVYGTHCQIFYRTLLDSKADPSLGSWTSEALVDSGNDDCEGNFGGPQVAIDESSGDVHAFKAVTGSNGASWSGVTYWHGTMGSSGTITWSSRLIVDGSGTSSTNPPDVAGAVDSSGKVYIFWATSVSGGAIKYATLASPFTSPSAATTVATSGTQPRYPHLPAQAPLTGGYVPLVYQTGTGNPYSIVLQTAFSISDTAPPTVPGNLVASTTKKPSVVLTWDASTDNVGVTGYTIYRDGSKLATVGGSTLTYEDTAVQTVTTYTYTVDAFDAAANHSAQSAPVSANAGDNVPPSVPAGVTATAGTTAQQVSVSWTASTDNVGVTGYTIYRGGTQLGIVSGSTLTYVDGTVAALTSYSYTVDAFDAAANHSAQSAAAAATTLQISYFNWFDLSSPGMYNDNIHLLNAGASAANVTVSMAGANPINVNVPAGSESYATFGRGKIGGPVFVASDKAIRASQRVQYYSTFNEVWAQTANQAATTSYITWFDKASPGMFNDNIHLLNPNGTSTTVDVSLPGAPTQSLPLAAWGGGYVTFPTGTIGGPVTVSASLPVLASQRVQYYSSFNEVWAQSAAQAATTSYVNWYDKASPGMNNDNIHLMNPGGSTATVTVTLAGATTQMVDVAAGAGAYVTFPKGSIGGPVMVSSTQPVLASQRVQYYSTFNEVSAQSAAQAATTSYVNWFDKSSVGMNNDNIHLLNPGGTSADVTVSVPGVPSQTATVAAGGEAYVTFPAGTIGGPVTITSTQPILASQRVQYFSSFNEIWAA